MAVSENTMFAAREVSDLVIVDYATKTPYINCDYANTSAVEITGDAVYAYGGQGHPKRVTFYGEKAGTLTIETQMTTMKLYAMVSGGTLSNTAQFIKREEIVAGSGSLTVTNTPIANTQFVYASGDDCGTAITGTWNDKTFTATGLTQGNTYIVYYQENISSGVEKLSVTAKSFPKMFSVYCKTTNRSDDGVDLPYEMVVYKCSPQLSFNVSQANDGDPITLTITCDIMADEDGNMIDLILMDAENEDYVAATGLTLDASTKTLANSGTATLVATVAPSTATNKNVSWASSNTELVTVSSAGVLTAAASGTGTTVVYAQAEDGGFIATCVVTVSA